MSNSQPIKHLLVIEDVKYRRTISLEETTYSIGRDPGSSIVVSSPQASRKHATLIRRKNSKNSEYCYWILDGDFEGRKSYNGIFVNGEKCIAKELKHGDLINFCNHVNATYYAVGNWSDTQLNLEKIKSRARSKTLIPSTATLPPRKKAVIDSESYLETSAAGETATSLVQTTLGGSDPQPLTFNPRDTIQSPPLRDPLTKLPNQLLFHEYLAVALGNAQRNQHGMAVLFLDLENFKKVNETLGYQIGNELLTEVAGRLKAIFRAGDVLARWNSDEFALLLSHINRAEEVNKIGQRILTLLQQPFEVSGGQIQLSGHLGLAVYPQDSQEASGLLKKAEADLSRNRQQGGTHLQGNGCQRQVREVQRLKVRNILGQALERQEFHLYFQPQVEVSTGKIRAMEALLRWQHPRLGEISPTKVIHLAEETDLIIPIGDWILKTACLQNKAWQQAGLPSVPVSVNLSPRQLGEANLVKAVERVLAETGLDPHCLELEVTEAAILQDVSRSRQALEGLQRLGVRLSMDDFGIGYSSLGYLKQFTFDTLKIAQSFIRDLSNDPQDRGIIAALIALGRSLNLTVVAEGVETRGQLEILSDLQCHYMQGYWFSQPLSAREATKKLESTLLTAQSHAEPFN